MVSEFYFKSLVTIIIFVCLLARIMKLSSYFFYESELQFTVSSDKELLRNISLKFPILFHSNFGHEQRTDDSPSWFNYSEILLIKDYLIQLKYFGVKADEIGIITPYRKQLEMIKRQIKNDHLLDCKLGTVEEFQGDERKVIIVSMVRSGKKRKLNREFIFNPKRFNVTLSRAKTLLIVIGDKQMLEKDKYWLKFIQYCEVNGSVKNIF